MSRIYAGDLASVDQEVLAALKLLPDDYWIFAGFHVGREVDWLVVRTAPPQEHSAIILTELKRYEHSVRGISQDAPWERQDVEGGWHVIDSGNDRNPYWQAVNSANALKHWLWNNQRLYHPVNGMERPEDDFGAWPIVLILSPPGVQHLLPLRPTNRYGAWVYDLERWMGMLQSWRPRKGVGLSSKDMQGIVAALGLSEVWHGSGTTSASQPAYEAPSEAPAQFLAWLGELASRVQELSERVEQLESTQRRPAPATDAPSPLHLVSNNHSAQVVEDDLADDDDEDDNGLDDDEEEDEDGPEPGNQLARTLSVDERSALVSAVQQAAAPNRSRAVNAVMASMDRELGYSLKERGYNGFGGVADLLQQAAKEGLIKFGPRRGAYLTVYLRDEEIAF